MRTKPTTFELFKKQHSRTLHTRKFPTRCGTCKVIARLEAAEDVIAGFASAVVRPEELHRRVQVWLKSKAQ